VPLLIVVVVSVAAGFAAWAGVRRWPQADPARAASDAVGDRLARRRGVRAFLRSRLDPAVTTGLALTAAVVALAVTGTIFGVVIYMVRRSAGVVTIDEWAARWAADQVHGASLDLLRAITWLGSTPVIVALAVAGAVVAAWRWRRPSVLLFITIVVAGQFLLMNLIKIAVERARPDLQRLSTFSGPSFPSGHATAAAATFAALAVIIGMRRGTSTRAILLGSGVAIAVAVGCSRILLGVHWFSDVVAGLALGWTWFAVCAVAFGGRLLRFGEPAKAAEGGERRSPERSHPDLKLRQPARFENGAR
jgi:undecaprenyl-diphosphatase